MKQLTRTEMLANSMFGYATNIYEFGEYTITQHQNKHKDVDGLMGDFVYCVYVNREPINQYCDDFDTAIAMCLSHKYSGRSSKSWVYVLRVLGINKED